MIFANFTNSPRGIVRGAGKRLETRQSDHPVRRQSLMSRCNRGTKRNAAGAGTGLAPAFCLILLSALCGCSYSKSLGRVQHPDGSGWTEYRTLSAGGITRPGVLVIISQTFGSNPPVVLTKAEGPPMAPNLLGNATGTAAGLFAGYAIGKDDGGGNTTIIQGDEPSPMIEPPKPPKPPPNPVVRPPNGRPPANRPPITRPLNRGHNHNRP